jgi:protein-disulfide isomerase
MRREQGGRPGSSKARTSAKPPAWRSPIFLVTAAAVVFAIGLIAFLNLKPGSSASSAAALTPPTHEIPAGLTQDGQTLGSATAPVTLDIWGDFQCPSCAKFVNTVDPLIIDKYVVPGQVKYRFNDFTFIGPESFDAAVAAACAGDQGKFWEYSGWVYANQDGENQGTFSKEFLASVADSAGLDRTKFDTCIADPAKLEAVKASTAAGAKIGVNQTPTLTIDGKVLQFTTYEELYGQIEAAIVAAGGTVASPAPASVAPASPSTAP